MGAPPSLPPVFVTSTYSSTKLDYTYGCAISSAAYVCKVTYTLTGLHYIDGFATLKAGYIC